MTDLALDADEVALRDMAATLFRRESPIPIVRDAEPTGFDPQLWSVLCKAELPYIGVDGQDGEPASATDLVIVAQEYGRALAPVPLIEATAAANLLSRILSAHDLLARVIAGELIPTLCLWPVTGDYAALVPAGSIANMVIAYRGGDLIAVVQSGADLPTRVPNLGDLPLADRNLAAGELTILASGEDARLLFADAVTEWKLLTAAALHGLGERALEIGVDYVKNRVAFGVPLGWFQAIQHRLADDATAGDGARLLVYEAAWARSNRFVTADRLASMAFVFSSDCALRTCRSSLQFHGGYGFSLEYDIQLYFRRAKAWPLVLGPRHRELAYLADELLGPSGRN
jgi:alkylation response protein AidB-like acyl-CoA dehydrogenase